jgi:hypothetical protein
MQIPLIEGRFFEADERLDKVQAIIVNREFTREVFPGEEHLWQAHRRRPRRQHEEL